MGRSVLTVAVAAVALTVLAVARASGLPGLTEFNGLTSQRGAITMSLSAVNRTVVMVGLDWKCKLPDGTASGRSIYTNHGRFKVLGRLGPTGKFSFTVRTFPLTGPGIPHKRVRVKLRGKFKIPQPGGWSHGRGSFRATTPDHCATGPVTFTGRLHRYPGSAAG